MPVLAKDLRAAVLQAAIQGKLTQQLPEDGDARDLLAQIKAEKEQLIKNKKIKKDRPLEPIKEDDVSFDIPDNWCWVRFGEIITLLSGADLSPSEYNSISNGIPYITGASNIENNSVIINRWTSSPKNIAYKDNLLLTCKGTVGKTVFLKEEKVHIARQIMSITIYSCDRNFIKLIVDAQIEYLKSKAKSMIPGIERSNVLNIVCALPPLAEQHRIVARVEELMSLIDEYEKIENQLTELKEKFPGDMKAGLLQAAMQGKLTGNNYCEDDENSIYVPLWSVTWWDKKFQKVEKSKQDKTISYYYYLAADMKALEQPSGDVFLLSTGDYKGWTTCEKAKDTVSEGEVVTIPWGGYPNVKYYKGKFVTTDNRIATSKNTDILSNKFLYYFMLSKVEFLDSIYRGTSLRHPDMSEVLEMNIPIMPIKEQQRIVEILDKLLPMCDELTE